ncbi:hypothetical protein ACFE04_005854 [Oxalis oulophora]
MTKIVPNLEKRDEIPYEGDALENTDEKTCNGQALTDFQRIIRLSKNETLGRPSEAEEKALLCDHQKGCNILEYPRERVHVSLISSRKGACFTNILGERVQYPRERVQYPRERGAISSRKGACFTNILGERVQYPREMRKGACFRDLAGLRVRPDNVVELDPNVPRPLVAPEFCHII